MGKKGEPKDPVALSAYVRDLLGPIDPELEPETPEEVALLEKSTQRLIRKKGEEYVKKHRQRLLEDWEYIQHLGV
jgi:hypothetical protein